MHTIHLFRSLKWMLLLAVVTLAVACEGLMQNPLKDKDSGEDINLLIVDFNFFRTHISVNLYDATTRERIELPAVLKFAGMGGKDIVTYSGVKRPSHEMLRGQLELTVDPNVKISESNPFFFSLTAEVPGYQTMSRTETYLSEGKKSVDLFLVKVTDETGAKLGGGVNTGGGDTTIVFGFAPVPGLKSAASDKLFRIKYTMTLNDFLKLKDSGGNLLFGTSQEFWDAYNANPSGFLYLQTSTFNSYPSWPDMLKMDGTSRRVILQILETGTVEYMSVGGIRVGNFNGAVLGSELEWLSGAEPSIWGYSTFVEDGWLFEAKQKSIGSLPFSYTVISASEETLCGLGARIRFEAGFKSSFTITADIYDMQNKLLLTKFFSGNFPADFTLENVPGVPARMVFRNNNPSFKPVADLEISSLCSGSYTVTVLQQDGFIGYQIVLKAFCPDNPAIAIAPSYSGQYRFAGASGTWQGGFMQGGVLDLLGKPDQEYEYRLLWENEWEVTNFTTTFNADGSYPFSTGSTIRSERLPDGRIRINVSHNFKQSVCDKMNW